MTRSGIINFGNICFLNSTIQFLISMDILVKEINSIDIYQNFMDHYNQENEASTPAVVNPGEIYHHYCQLNPLYQGGSQGDAQECLVLFLDYFASQRMFHSFKITFKQFILRLNEPEKSKERFSASIITENILNCEFSASLEESINNYMSEDNHPILKKYEISIFPQYLCISVKRFNTTFEDGNYVSCKNDTPMSISSELVLGYFTYQLIGFIFHHGTIENGHYIYYGLVKDNDSEHWMVFNDHLVFGVQTEHALQMACRGYIYLYSLIET